MKWIGAFLLFCSMHGSAFASTVSIIIPCYHGHFNLLDPLLDQLAHQTVPPNEVVVAISEAHLVQSNALRQLAKKAFPFKLRLISSEQKRSAGKNRNIACEAAKSEILICQDADDLPHPQRVEIIQYIFDKYPIDHLIHRWIPDPSLSLREDKFYWGTYDKNSLYPILLNDFSDIDAYDYIHHGNIAIRKSVFEKVKWQDSSDGEDKIFNRQCCEKIRHTAFLDAFLLIYRNYLSSHQ